VNVSYIQNFPSAQLAHFVMPNALSPHSEQCTQLLFIDICRSNKHWPTFHYVSSRVFQPHRHLSPVLPAFQYCLESSEFRGTSHLTKLSISFTRPYRRPLWWPVRNGRC